MNETAYIVGLGSFLPNQPVANEDMEKVLGPYHRGLAKERVLETCGVTSRYYALHPETGEPTHTNAQLCAEAVRSALQDGGRDVHDLGLLACGTSTPDQLMPGHASMVHGELGGSQLEAVSFAGICTSGMLALKHAWYAIRTGEHQLAAATGSEICGLTMRASRFKEEDESISVEELRKNPALSMSREFLRWLLSDGAGCMLLAPQPREGGVSLRIDWIDGSSRANEFPPCMFMGAEWDRQSKRLRTWMAEPDLEVAVARNYFSITQNVALLNRKLVPAGIVGVLGEIVSRRGLRASDYDWFFPHMSSFYFKSHVETALAEIDFTIPEDRWFTNLAHAGNIGAGSIFTIIDEAYRAGMLEKGQKILCVVPESGRFSFYYMQLTVV